MAAVMFQGPPLLKVGGSLGPHFIILDPSLVVFSRERKKYKKSTFNRFACSMFIIFFTETVNVASHEGTIQYTFQYIPGPL